MLVGSKLQCGIGNLMLMGVKSMLMYMRVCVCIHVYNRCLYRMPSGSSGLVTRLFCNAHLLASVLPVSRAINNQQPWAVLMWMSTQSVSSRQEALALVGWKFMTSGFRKCVHPNQGTSNVCLARGLLVQPFIRSLTAPFGYLQPSPARLGFCEART